MQSKGKQRRTEINIAGTVVMRTASTSSAHSGKDQNWTRTIVKSTTKQRWSSRRLEVTRLPASQQVFHADAKKNSHKFTCKNLTIRFTRENTISGQKALWQG